MKPESPTNYILPAYRTKTRMMFTKLSTDQLQMSLPCF